MRSDTAASPSPTSHAWATLLATILVLVFRRPDAFLYPQFFVEDGTVFFADDHHLGAQALLRPYGGCLQLLPRLVALLASTFPLEMRPAVYVYACLVLLCGLTLHIVNPRIPLTHRPAFALAVLLAPVGASVYLHLADIQWFGALALLMLLLQRPATAHYQWVLDFVLLGILGLTGPFSLALLFLWPLRAIYYGPNHYDTLGFAVVAATAMTQSHFLLEAYDGLEAGRLSHLTVEFVATHATRLVLGDQWPAYLGEWNLVPAALFASILLVLLIWTPRQYRFPSLVFMLAGVLATLLGLYRTQPEADNANAFTFGIGYFFIPHVCALWCALPALNGPRLLQRLTQGLLALSLLSAASHFDMAPPRDFAWGNYCDRIRAGEPVVVPINWPGWKITVNFPTTPANHAPKKALRGRRGRQSKDSLDPPSVPR